MNKETTENFDWEFWNYALDLKKEWQNSLPRFTDKELLKIFPEAKKVIPEKIKEWEEKRARVSEVIKKKLILIRERVNDEFSKYFWREWIKVNEGEELLKIDWQIARLKRLSMVAKKRKSKGQLTEEQIQQALAVPIESLITYPLKKWGKALVGLCPFHPERHPSFYIYPETNSCWCYGCNQGGNVINFVRLLYGYSFKDAVKYLIGENEHEYKQS
jgi:hypothetical protein